MNLALALTTQLLLAQADPGAAQETDPQTQVLEEIRDRLAAIETRLEALEQGEQLTADEDVAAEIAALREEAAALQETAQAPASAVEVQLETLELRQAAVQNATAAIEEAYRVIDTGEEDAGGSLDRAYSAFEEAWLLATEAGSPEEAQRFAEAMQAISGVTPALAQRDFSQAKMLLDVSRRLGQQGLQLAQSTATLPLERSVTAAQAVPEDLNDVEALDEEDAAVNGEAASP